MCAAITELGNLHYWAADTCERDAFVQDRGYIQQKLQEQGVNCVIRMLQLGDFMWVARRRRTMDEALLQAGDDSSGENELVLGYIGERKRMDDLSSSIVDGRFREQHVCTNHYSARRARVPNPRPMLQWPLYSMQFRLSQCGLEHVIYLVENYGSLDSHSVAAERLQTAMVTYGTQTSAGMRLCIEHQSSKWSSPLSSQSASAARLLPPAVYQY